MLSPLANPQSGFQSSVNEENQSIAAVNPQVTNINIGQDESGTKTCLLNFQIQVPPHEDTQILNIVVYRDDHQESTISTDDSNLKMVFGNPKHGIKVAVSKQQNM